MKYLEIESEGIYEDVYTFVEMVEELCGGYSDSDTSAIYVKSIHGMFTPEFLEGMRKANNDYCDYTWEPPLKESYSGFYIVSPDVGYELAHETNLPIWESCDIWLVKADSDCNEVYARVTEGGLFANIEYELDTDLIEESGFYDQY